MLSTEMWMKDVSCSWWGQVYLLVSHWQWCCFAAVQMFLPPRRRSYQPFTPQCDAYGAWLHTQCYHNTGLTPDRQSHMLLFVYLWGRSLLCHQLNYKLNLLTLTQCYSLLLLFVYYQQFSFSSEAELGEQVCEQISFPLISQQKL